MNLHRTSFLFTTLVLALTFPVAAEENDRYARVVLFVEEGAEPPEQYEARLASLARRTEAFFAQWMAHWSRPIERPEIFARKADGSIEVTLVKSRLLNPKGRAALPGIRQKAIESATAQTGLTSEDAPVIWWIFYDYPEVKGFQGGARGTGGVAINAYPPGSGPIDLDTELADGAMHEMAIKGTIHEFGHALGLPHTGPRPDVDLGNSLMGPINRSFWQKSGSDDVRVYLTESSAAALWKHPIFQEHATAEPQMPASVAVDGLSFDESENGDSLTIRGRLDSSDSAHSVVVYDSERGEFGDYWSRTYTAPVDHDTGAFEVTITAPFRHGSLYLSFYFDSGINTGDGQRRFQQGGLLVGRYTGELGNRLLLQD